MEVSLQVGIDELIQFPVLSGACTSGSALKYLSDIIVYNPELSQHLQKLREVFQYFHTARLNL